MTSEARRNMFGEWMSTQWGDKKMLHTESNCRQYAKWLEEMTGKPVFAGIAGLPGSLFDCGSVAAFGEVEAKLRGAPGFDAFDRATQKRLPSAVLLKYRAFIAWLENTPKGNEVWDCLQAGKVFARMDGFEAWLRKQTSPQTGRKYAARTVDGYVAILRSKSYRGLNFFALDTAEKVVAVAAILDRTRDYRQFAANDHNKLASALEAYGRYLGSASR